MPRVTFSNDPFERYHASQSSIVDCSPSDIDKILSRKLYNQLQTTISPSSTNEQPSYCHRSESHLKPLNMIDSELIELIDQFFRLAYLNTIPIVNLLATAVATNFLKENISELDNRLQQSQHDLRRRSSSFYNPEEDDDDLSWVSAPA